MHTLLFALVAAVVLMVLVVLGEAHGSTDCEFIDDGDQRNYCRAITKKQQSYCEFIRDRDLRHRCRAEVKSRKINDDQMTRH